MHNIVSSAIEEILSFRPGSCHACRGLHEDLKAALMRYLLATTNLYVHGEDVAHAHMQNVESDLADAIREFDLHRGDTHFVDYFTLPRTEIPIRNAS